MTYMLKFKQRSLSKLTIPKRLAEDLLKQSDPLVLMQLFQKVVDNPEHYHDKDHFEMIVNWTPPNQGISFVESSQWVQIALMVAELDTTKEQTIEFTENQKVLLYKRLRDPRFSVFGVNTPYYQFVADLEKAFGEPIYQEEEADSGDKD